MIANDARPSAGIVQALDLSPAWMSTPWKSMSPTPSQNPSGVGRAIPASRGIAVSVLLMALAWAGLGCGGDASPEIRAEATLDAVRVGVALDRPEIRIGEPVVATIRVDHPDGARVSIDDPGRSNAVRVLDRQWAPPAAGRTQVEYGITSFVVGDHAVFTGSVRVAKADAKDELSVPIPVISLKVNSSVAEGDEELPPPAGLVDWPPAVPRWIWVLPLIAALAAAVGWFAARLRRRARRPRPGPPPTPPHEIAMAALRRLEAQGWMESDASEPFYVELSRIVRVYLEDRFGLRAPERTTEEFIRDAAESGTLSAAHRALAAEFLESSDLVKFARARPGAESMRSALKAAERLVRETIPSAPPPPESSS